MKIIELKAENVKRLRAVEIRPDENDNLVIVSGANAQGKTSVLDAIWFALGGGEATFKTPHPIREGESEASVTLDLGELTVTRVWRRDKPVQLKVVAADGAKYSSPQRMLDKLTGLMSFDPLVFTRLPRKEQRDMLEGLVELPFNPKEIQRARAQAYELRTEVGRDVTRARGAVERMTPPAEDVPDELVDVAELSAKLQQVHIDHATYLDAKQRTERVEQEVVDLTAEVERLRRVLELAERDLAGAIRRRDQHQETFRDCTDPDPSEILQQMQSVEEINQAVRDKRAWVKATQELRAREERYNALTEEIRELDEEQRQGLAEAKFPVEGLSFDDEGVLYKGVPFLQCSAAEQLRVSIGMAMAVNPDIRVIRITDGSLLDSQNLELIREMAAEKDFQVWIERVDESGEVGIVIEDGTVRA